MHSNTISRRTDYTFKYNSQIGRHGWLRLTPAYSVKLVKEIIKEDCIAGDLILDPFSGTATTGLVAAELGYNALLFDINPFLIWLGNTKCQDYTIDEIMSLELQFGHCISTITLSNKAWLPPIFKIERWWHVDTLNILSGIRQRIVECFGEPEDNKCYNIVWIAFSRLIIETSSAAFNHVSMSFKDTSTKYELSYITDLFKTIFSSTLETIKAPIAGNARVVKGDSRNLMLSTPNKYNVVITSPPYPNRISYIRELRPYMYWSKFLNNGSDAGVLDWEAIGGTWGTATSNLKNWTTKNLNLPTRLYQVCKQIEESGDKNSQTMSLYVHKYFDDMYSHLDNLRSVLTDNARLNYIVGNSSFYGNFVETEKILLESMQLLGYENIVIQTIRKRNTKKGLLEFNIKAKWQPK